MKRDHLWDDSNKCKDKNSQKENLKKKKKLKEPNRCSRFEKYNIRNKFTGYI